MGPWEAVLSQEQAGRVGSLAAHLVDALLCHVGSSSACPWRSYLPMQVRQAHASIHAFFLHLHQKKSLSCTQSLSASVGPLSAGPVVLPNLIQSGGFHGQDGTGGWGSCQSPSIGGVGVLQSKPIRVGLLGPGLHRAG